MSIAPRQGVRDELIMKMIGEPNEVFVRPGLSIGRAASNVFRISDPGVEHIHARVFQVPEMGLILRAESPSAKITTANGATHEQLLLGDGVHFTIGSAEFVCERHAAAAAHSVREEPALPPQSGGPVGSVRCPVCHGDIRTLATDQRQCPHCSSPINFFDAPAIHFSGWIPLVVGPFRAQSFLAADGAAVRLVAAREGDAKRFALAFPAYNEADPAFADACLSAARALVGLTHENILPVLEADRYMRLTWLSSEHPEAWSMDQLIAGQLRKRQYPVFDAIAPIVLQMARALEFLHAKGIAHGRFIPQNILMTGGNVIKTTNFGLPATTPLPAGYAAPEARSGRSNAQAADMYAFGAVVYALLTLRSAADGVAETLSIRPDCPAALHSLVGMCLDADPARRLTAGEVASGVRFLLANPEWNGFAELRDARAGANVESADILDNGDTLRSFDPMDDAEAFAWGAAEEEGESEEEDAEVDAALPEKADNVPAKTRGKRKKKKSSKLVPLALGGLVALVALVIGGGVVYNLFFAPSIVKVESHLAKGDKEGARAMLKTMAEKHNDIQAMAMLGKMFWEEKDYRSARLYLERPANESSTLAQALMGEMIVTEKISGIDMARGVDYLKKGARDNALAQYWLGKTYYDGVLVEKDEKNAMLLINQASAKGEPLADLAMGVMHLAGGDDFPQDVQKAEECFQRAAHRGNVEAAEKLAEMYLYGAYVDQDFSKSAQYTEMALARKSRVAREPLAYMLYFGKGMTQDRSRGASLANAILETDPPNGMGNYIIGMAYILGNPLEQDATLGFHHLLRAVDAENPFATYDLARALFNGELLPQDYNLAFEFFSKLSEKRFRPADLYLGKYYFSGIEPAERDYEKAYTYFRSADVSEDIDAEAMLGILCIERRADEEEEREGMAMVEKAARLDSMVANAYLGTMCVTGIGRPRDLDKAISYLTKPALSIPDARYWLGRARYEQEDYDGALNDFSLAADRRVPEANLYLGKMYYLGRGVGRDYKLSYWRLAHAASHVDAEGYGMLTKICYFGLAGERDLVLAASFLSKIPANDDELRLISADLSYHGYGGVKQDRKKALDTLEELVKTGYTPASVKLGGILYAGDGIAKDQARAYKLFEQAANEGHPEAWYMLGKMYHEGGVVERDDSLAQYYLEEAIFADQMDAKTLLGKMFFRGDGVPADHLVGVDLLTEASRFGIEEAQLFLGDIYIRGDGVPRDVNVAAMHVKKLAERGNADARVIYAAAALDPSFSPKPDYTIAIEYLEPEAAADNPVALRLMGEICFHGWLPERQNFAEAAYYFSRAVDNGDVKSARYLAQMYDKGEGVPRDPEKASRYMAVLSDSGDASVQWRLAEVYLEKGAGNEDKAFEVFKRLADAGNAKAMYRVGMMYDKGIGVAGDQVEAFRYYSLAEQKGDVQACSPLGEMYFDGRETARDYGRAARLLAKGKDYLTTRGDAMLGWLSYFGLGAEQSNSLALTHLEKAIRANEPLAAAALAKIYLDGVMVVENYSKAMNYAQMALPLNFPVTYYVMGRLHYEGLGVPKNERLGKEYLEKAAEEGSADAQYYLGSMYRGRIRDSESAQQAYRYLKMAADQGHAQAKSLIQTMSPR